MFSFENLAPKLLINEITNAPAVETATGPKLTTHGIHYSRVQILVRRILKKDAGFHHQDLNLNTPSV